MNYSTLNRRVEGRGSHNILHIFRTTFRAGRHINFRFGFSDAKSFPDPCRDKSFSADFGVPKQAWNFKFPACFTAAPQLELERKKAKDDTLRTILLRIHNEPNT